MQTLAEFGGGQFLWSMVWFTMFFIWIWLLIVVFGDIFRSTDMGGVAKAIWIFFVIVLPYFGVLAYLIARGGKMHEHAVAAAQVQDIAARDYIQSVTGSDGASAATEITRLAALRDSGTITEAEFQAAKTKALS